MVTWVGQVRVGGASPMGVANVRDGRGKGMWAWCGHVGGASVKDGRDKCMWAGHEPVGGASMINGRDKAMVWGIFVGVAMS